MYQGSSRHNQYADLKVTQHGLSCYTATLQKLGISGQESKLYVLWVKGGTAFLKETALTGEKQVSYCCFAMERGIFGAGGFPLKLIK